MRNAMTGRAVTAVIVVAVMNGPRKAPRQSEIRRSGGGSAKRSDGAHLAGEAARFSKIDKSIPAPKCSLYTMIYYEWQKFFVNHTGLQA
jgi:hypothetical protein